MKRYFARRPGAYLFMSRGKHRPLWTALFCTTTLLCSGLSAAGSPQSKNEVRLVAPLYITSTDFMSVLTIRSDDSTVRVLVRFDSLEGQEVGRRLVGLGPRSSADIDIDDVEMVEHRFPELGSISLWPMQAGTIAVTGYVKIASRKREGEMFVEENLQIEDDMLRPIHIAFVPSSLSVPVLAIHSLSKQPQNVSINCSDGEGLAYQSDMILPPGMTFLVNACTSRKSESRTYEQLLQGDSGEPKKAMNIQVRGGEIAVWGFATKGATALSKPQISSIEFDVGPHF
jgi:hypothetical protein